MSRSEASQPKSNFQHFTGEHDSNFVPVFSTFLIIFAEFIYFSHKMDETYWSWSYLSRTVMILHVNSLKFSKKNKVELDLVQTSIEISSNSDKSTCGHVSAKMNSKNGNENCIKVDG